MNQNLILGLSGNGREGGPGGFAVDFGFLGWINERNLKGLQKFI